ncbi:hypothetical protein RvY_05775 [Ramazzottius varieornatus]|uniref:Uncharacterized protein n=1 Tax=Ramazzottius varieornatus TaxID=947166 RepID=A0A1D1V1S9_RAMVA|nr:hypothetical protein RvY_05775 [Ramazzottius varieornatus]
MHRAIATKVLTLRRLPRKGRNTIFVSATVSLSPVTPSLPYCVSLQQKHNIIQRRSGSSIHNVRDMVEAQSFPILIAVCSSWSPRINLFTSSSFSVVGSCIFPTIQTDPVEMATVRRPTC